MTEREIRRRAAVPWLVVVVGVAASLGAWRLACEAEQRAIRAHFERHAVERALSLQYRLADALSAVESLGVAFAASQQMSRADFRATAQPLLARHRALRALSWNQCVRHPEREAHESEARREVAGYRITERSADGSRLVAAARRPEYVVVRYIEPLSGNESALGYDVRSELRRRAALERAAETGAPTLTSGIRLVQDPEQDWSLLAFWPHYRLGSSTATSGERREDLLGFAVGVFQVSDLVQSALRPFDPDEARIQLEDATWPDAVPLLYAPPASADASDPGPASPFEFVSSFEEGGRTWQVRFVPTAHALAEHHGWIPLATMLAGFVITGLFAAYLSILLARAKRMEQLADEREQRRRLDAKLQQAQKLESLGVLAGGVAHDFNNLLTGILGNADLALATLDPAAPVREEIEQVRLAATRAADLTRQMLAYSGAGRFRSESVDLSQLVQEMVHLFGASISKRARLRCAFGSETAVDGDPGRLRQVVMNLIVNASDALEGRVGEISLRTGARHFDRAFLAGLFVDEALAPGRYVFLEVSDTGCGMDAATRARIFDPFFTTRVSGRGLGLAAVLGILRRHCGGIRVDSEPGRGSRFTVLLPPATTAASTVRESPASDDELWRGSGSVLVVDDEEPVRRFASRALASLGFAVHTAADGEEGLEIFRKHAAEIVAVLLDVTMPGMSGPETLRALRAIQPNVAVLLSSGYVAEDGLDRRASPDGFLAKPYSSRDLARALRRLLGG